MTSITIHIILISNYGNVVNNFVPNAERSREEKRFERMREEVRSARKTKRREKKEHKMLQTIEMSHLHIHLVAALRQLNVVRATLHAANSQRLSSRRMEQE